MTIEKEELATLLPHSGRMLLLSRINEYDPEKRYLCAEYDITEDCLFYDPNLGGVPAWAGFEFMAQGLAALSGLCGREKGEKPKIGFILSISSLRISFPFFKTGSTALIKITESGRMESVYSFEGEIFCGGEKFLEGKLTAMDASDKQIKSMIKEKTLHD